MPFLGAALTVVWVAGFTATAGRIGARMRGQSPGNGGAADVFFAFIALASLTIVGHVPALGPPALTPIATVLAGTGFFVKYVAWTVGLGAAISAVVRGRPHLPPPPLSLPQLA